MRFGCELGGVGAKQKRRRSPSTTLLGKAESYRTMRLACLEQRGFQSRESWNKKWLERSNCAKQAICVDTFLFQSRPCFSPFIIIFMGFCTLRLCLFTPSPPLIPPLLIHPPLQPRACHPLLRDQVSHQAVPTRTITLEARPEAAAGKLHQRLPFQVRAIESLRKGKGGEGGQGGKEG